MDLFLQQKAQQIFKDISILIYGNVVINELLLRLKAVRNFQDKSDSAWGMGCQTQFWDSWQP